LDIRRQTWKLIMLQTQTPSKTKRLRAPAGKTSASQLRLQAEALLLAACEQMDLRPAHTCGTPAHAVRLSEQALELLNRARELEHKPGYHFHLAWGHVCGIPARPIKHMGEDA
jgi:hypothetical protein